MNNRTHSSEAGRARTRRATIEIEISLDKTAAIRTVATAALAVAIAVGLLSGVTILFQHQGTPWAHVAAAELACSSYGYVSERETCIRDRLALRKPA